MSGSGAALAVPADFPVRWARPEEASLFWTREAVHFPQPVVPLFDAFAEAHDAGFRAAFEAYGVALRAYHLRRIHSYVYSSAEPLDLPAEELRARDERSEERLRAAAARLAVDWEETYLPELGGHLAHWRSLPLRELGDAQLPAVLEETLGRQRRLWTIHFLVMLPTLVAMSQFDEFCGEVLPGGDAFASYRLLQGFDNKTLEVDRALWAVGQLARTLPDAQAALELPPAEAPAALGASAETRPVLQALQAFLARYGERGDAILFSVPSWIENPATVLKNLRDAARDGTRDPEAKQRRLAAEREAALAAARARLAGFPGPVRERFEGLLRSAQAATVLSEEHAHYTDHAGTYHLRRVLLEAGRRLAAAGALPAPDDVFLLRLPELREALGAPPGGTDLAASIAERRAELARCAGLTPPPALGTEPAGEAPRDALSVAIGKFFGRPPQDAGDAATLRGQPGSPGTARGPVRVLVSLAEASKLGAGDILVAPATLPPWTPLFATAAAVVTDTGGALSHCAIVAREYRIPAVVGTGRATALLRDGDTVEVCGDRGEVRIIARGPGA